MLKSFEQLLREARDGDDDALGQLLQDHRNYLLAMVNSDMESQIRPKVGSSDIVQEALLTAYREFDQFSGESSNELVAWLRQICKHDLSDAERSFKRTKKRQISREKPIEPSSKLMIPLPDTAATPSTEAMASEQSKQLNAAMEKLSTDYQTVLKLRNWEQLSFEEIGQQMGRSAESVRKLWTRAVLKIQQYLEE